MKRASNYHKKRHPWEADINEAKKRRPIRKKKHKGPKFKISREKLQEYIDEYTKNGGRITKIGKTEKADSNLKKSPALSVSRDNTPAADEFLTEGNATFLTINYSNIR